MRITKKNYISMTHVEYADHVLQAIQDKLGEDGAGLLMAGFDPYIISCMINDACGTFRYLNYSPRFTAYQVIRLMTQQNLKTERM